MTINDFVSELKKWRLTKYKAINFAIGISALLIYEFVGRPIYRPYIYNNKINDFHIADTLGNTLGTLPTIFFLIAILSNDTAKGNYLIKLGTFSVVVFELAHPLLGKPIDIWDIIATILTGFVSYLERVGELKKTGSRVTFVVAKLQGDDQTVYSTDRLPVGRNIAFSTPQTQT